jgi:hypothetical protein
VLVEPADFAENFTLASLHDGGGIKLGTVRKRSTPRVRAVSTFPITHTTGRQESSSRVASSRLFSSPFAEPPRSDHSEEECRPGEEHTRLQDQGGPR